MAEEYNEHVDQIAPGSAPEGTLAHGAEGSPPAEVARPASTPERKALVQEIVADIKRRRKRFGKAFDQMRADMAFVKKGASKEWGAGRYVAHIAHRHVQQRVSSLYAKNPTPVAKRRKTVDYQIWDGNAATLMQAQQVMATISDPMAGEAMAADPALAGAMVAPAMQAQALMADVQQAQARIQMLNRLGQTLECLFRYYIVEDTPTFKLQAKQLVRRAVTCGVGYVKLGFQRIMGRSSKMETKIADFRDQIAHAERLAKEIAEGKIEGDSPRVEELRLALQMLMETKDAIIREGLVFGFPRSSAIIPDDDTRAIKGWVGTRRVAEEFLFTKAKVKELYGVDLGEEYTSYTRGGNSSKRDGGYVMVWEEYDRDSGLMYTVCDGYCDFLEEPTAPTISLEQFFPYYPLAFNDVESDDDGDIFPPSDVFLIQDAVMEVNRSREALRQHRRANAPKYGVPAGTLDDPQKEKLASAMPHEVIEFAALAPGSKINDLIQKFDHAAIDPALYDVSPLMDDILRSVGSQEANLGPTSGATATESSIAEGSRLASQSSAIDDLDDMLSLLARDGSQVMLAELNEETVKKIAGPGAVWPSMSSEEIVEETWLEVAAGSSGRPNKAQEIDNMQKLVPLLIQVPGIPPQFLARELVKRLDDRIDISEAYIDGLPSITAMNAVKSPQPEDGQDKAEDQGAEGGDNGPRSAERSRGSGAGGQPGAMRGR